jgi:hypothetical protein
MSALAWYRSLRTKFVTMILYDNTKIAVAKILGGTERQPKRTLSELQSHYLFADKFGWPAKDNDKGKVEGLVGCARRNSMVPVLRFATRDAFNAHLEARCGERSDRKLRGRKETIGERFERDRAAFLSLPEVPYEACEKVPARVSSLALMRSRQRSFRAHAAWRDLVSLLCLHGGLGSPQSNLLKAKRLRATDALVRKRQFLDSPAGRSRTAFPAPGPKLGAWATLSVNGFADLLCRLSKEVL